MRTIVLGGTLTALCLAAAPAFGQGMTNPTFEEVKRRAIERRQNRSNPVRQQSQNPYEGTSSYDYYDPTGREAAQRYRAAKAAVSIAIEPSLFTPGRVEDLRRYMEGLATIAYYDKRDCTAAFEHRANSRDRRRSLAPAQQYALADEARQARAACNALPSASDVTAGLTQVRSGVSRWASAQPASIDGLKGINAAAKGYRYGWRGGTSHESTGDILQRSLSAAQGALFERRDAIVSSVRPTLVAAAKQPGRSGLLDDLFGEQQSYRDQFAASLDPRPAFGSGRANGAPLPNTNNAVSAGVSAAAILSAHAQAYAQHFNAQATSTPGEVGYPSPFGGIAYYERRYLTNLSCRRLAGGDAQCSYAIAKTFTPAHDSLLGHFATNFMQPTSPARMNYTFKQRGGVLTSAALNAEVAEQARQSRLKDQQARQRGGQDYDEVKRQQRFDDCMREVRVIPCPVW